MDFKIEENIIMHKIREELKLIGRLKKEFTLTRCKLKAIEQENIQLDESISRLKEEIGHVQALVESDVRDKTYTDIRANRLHVRQKLKQKCKQQQLEIQVLTTRLEKLQMNTFPVFN